MPSEAMRSGMRLTWTSRVSIAAHLDIGHSFEALEAANDHVLGESVEAFARPVGAEMEPQDRPVRALKPADPDPFEIGGEPVANPVDAVADIDRGQIHVGAVDKANADVAR